MKRTQLSAGGYVTHAVKLVRLLAEGGMGRVWLAEHEGLKAEVVVKLMADEIAARPDGAERFAREAAVAAAIKSPHVVQVFDHGLTADGTPYIVMERLEGRDLAAHLAEEGRMDPRAVLTLVVQVGKALSKAHRESIIHRDIKPDNIFLCDTGFSDSAPSSSGAGGPPRAEGGEIFAKLLDFGTARRDDPLGSSATVPGQILGTPHYMSPEQSVGGDVDERSDIWSLGVVAFEALTGSKPFDGASVGAITVAIHGVLPKMTDLVPELPPAVDAWFARACAQSPSERFASVREQAEALALAITGATLVDQYTEAVHFPVAPAASGASTPPRPVTRPIGPLTASLPPPGAAQRPTAIAAGLVMIVTAAAMIGIVVHRSPAPEPEAEPVAIAAPPSDEARGDREGAAPVEERAEEALGAAPTTATAPARRPAAAPPRTAQASGARAKAKAPRAAQVTQSAPAAKPAAKGAQAAAAPQPKPATPKAPEPAAPAKAPQGGGEASAADDDDLARLQKAATKATAEYAETSKERPAASSESAPPAPPKGAEPAPPLPEPSGGAPEP